LHDELSFEGPLDRFSRADDYIQAVRRLDAICKRVAVRKVGQRPDVALVPELDVRVVDAASPP